MLKKVLLAVLIILVIVGVLVWWNKKEPPVVVDSPQPGETVTSPLTITGKAKGTWFFEGSFPVRLLDALGNEVAIAPAQAQGKWMTEEYVPFEVTLTFNVSPAQHGTIVLQKDNPSGRPENDAQVEVAVWLEPGENSPNNTTSVKAFFGNNTMQGDECSAVYPVTRTVPATQAVARAALEELFKGPTVAEKAQGFFTVIPAGVTIQSLEIRNSIAYVDLSKELEAGVAGSCLVVALRSQIESTLKQFPTVSDVVISVDGRTDDILQP